MSQYLLEVLLDLLEGPIIYHYFFMFVVGLRHEQHHISPPTHSLKRLNFNWPPVTSQPVFESSLGSLSLTSSRRLLFASLSSATAAAGGTRARGRPP